MKKWYLLPLLLGVALLAACQAVPEELLSVPASVKSVTATAGTPLPKETPYAVNIGQIGEPLLPGESGQTGDALIELEERKLDTLLSVRGTDIRLQGTAYVPTRGTIAVYEAEYIQPIDENSFSIYCTDYFGEEPYSILSPEELLKYGWNEGMNRVGMGDKGFVFTLKQGLALSFWYNRAEEKERSPLFPEEERETRLPAYLNTRFRGISVNPVLYFAELGEEDSWYNYEQLLGGLPIAGNPEFINGNSAEGNSPVLSLSVVNRDVDRMSGDTRIVLPSGHIRCCSVQNLMRITGIEEELAEIYPLESLLAYLQQGDNGIHLLKPTGRSDIKIIRMVYVPVRSMGKTTLRPCWELMAVMPNEGSTLSVYRYSALAADYADTGE